MARSWRGLGTVFSIIWPSGLCQNPSIIRYRAAGVFSGKALADCKLPLLEIPQYRGEIDFLRACQKRYVFWSLPLSSRLYKVCLWGAPGGASRRQKWFSLRRCCKINKNSENRSKNVKIEARAPTCVHACFSSDFRPNFEVFWGPKIIRKSSRIGKMGAKKCFFFGEGPEAHSVAFGGRKGC